MANEKTEHDEEYVPSVPFKTCPIRKCLGIMGKKWTMLILRDIGFMKVDRFGQMLRVTPGLTPRLLSMRLRELQGEGFIEPVRHETNPRIVRWRLTEKGRDTLPVLMSLIEFGSKWYPSEVFQDSRPRGLQELFPNLESG